MAKMPGATSRDFPSITKGCRDCATAYRTTGVMMSGQTSAGGDAMNGPQRCPRASEYLPLAVVPVTVF